MQYRAAPTSKILETAFRESLDNIILISTKQQETTTIRHVAYATRENGYRPTEVLYVFLLTCKVCGQRSMYRNLLYHCLSDLCKFFALNVMTVTNMEARAVCDMVRCLAFVKSAPPHTERHSTSENRGTNSVHGFDNDHEKGRTFLGNHSFSLLSNELDFVKSQSNLKSIDPRDYSETRQASTIREKTPTLGATAANAEMSHTLYTLVGDNDMVIRLLQVIVALSSVCPLNRSVLMEPLGLLLTMYPSVPPGCMAEEVLKATLMQHTHAYCNALLDREGSIDISSTGDNLQTSTAKGKSSLPLLLQAAGYFKDLCDLSAGQWPTSLPLSTVPLGSHGLFASHVGNSSGTAFQAWFDLIETVKSSQPQRTESLFLASPSRLDSTKSCALDISYRLRKLALELLLSYFTDTEGEAGLSKRLELSATFPSGVNDEDKTLATEWKDDTRVAMSENPRNSVGVCFFQCLNEKVVGLALACRPYLTEPGLGEDKEGSNNLIYRAGKANEDTERFSGFLDQDSGAGIYDSFFEGSHLIQPTQIARREAEIPSNEELFILTQKLALVALGKFPIVMRNTASDLAAYHAVLLKKFRLEDLPGIFEQMRSQLASSGSHVPDKALGRTMSKEALGDALTYRDEGMLSIMLKVLDLWRKIAESDRVPSDLFLTNCTLNRVLQEESIEPYEQRSDELFTATSTLRSHHYAYSNLFRETALLVADMIEGISAPLSAVVHSEHFTTEDIGIVAESTAPSEELTGSTKQRKPHVGSEPPTQPKVGRQSGVQHPKTPLSRACGCLSYIVDLMSILIVFTKRFTQIVDKLFEKRGVGADGEGKRAPEGGVAQDQRAAFHRQRERILRHVFLSLHPSLLRCVQSFLEHIEGVDEMLHCILTIATECVYVCGMLGLIKEQKGYFQALIGALYIEDALGDMLINLILQQHPEAVGMWELSGPQTGAWRKETTAFDSLPTRLHGKEGSKAPETTTDPHPSTYLRHWVANKVRRISINFTRGDENVKRTNPLMSSSASEATIAFSPAASCASLFKENELTLSVAVEGLHRKLVILKLFFLLARRMIIRADAWPVVAEALSLVEPLIYRLRLFLLWIPEDSVGRQAHEKLLCDAHEMRDTMHSLCLECAQQLSEELFVEFLVAMVRATEQLCSRTQDRLYKIFHLKCATGQLADAAGNSQDAASPHSHWKTLPNGFGAFAQLELMCESLGLVYLFLLPLHAPRAALVGQHRRWLCTCAMHHSRLSRWCALLWRCPLAVSPLACWGAPARAARGGGGPAKVSSGPFLFPFPFPARFDELHHALLACVGDVVGVAAYVSRWCGRLRSALAASVARGPAFLDTTTGEALFAQVVEPTLPAGLLLAGRLSELVGRHPLLFASAHGTPSLPAPPPQRNGLFGDATSAAGTFVVGEVPRPLTPEEMLQRLTSNLVDTAMCGAESFSFIQEMYDIFSCIPVWKDNGNGEPENILGESMREMNIGSEGDYPFSDQQQTPHPSWHSTPHSMDALQSAHLSFTLGLSIGTLREVLCLVQCCGEDISSEPWRHLLRMLRKAVDRASTASMLVSAVGSLPGEGYDDRNSHQGAFLPGKDRKSLPPLGSSGLNSRAVSVSTETLSNLVAPLPSAHSAHAVALGDIVQLAYRILEVIQHNYITNMHTEELRELIFCASTFITNYAGGAKGKQLHINLSAIQMIWSIADYLAVVRMSSGFSDANSEQGGTRKSMDATLDNLTTDMTHHDWDALFCALLLHLQDEGCMDTRQEVRQSAQKTLFSILQTYGEYFSGDCWHYVLRDMMVPLMDVVLVSQVKCAITADPPRSPLLPDVISPPSPPTVVHNQTPNQERNMVCSFPKQESAERSVALLNAFENEPRQIEQMRAILTDSIGRVLLSHYNHIRSALHSREKNLSLSLSSKKSLLYEVLFQFIDFCGESRVVVWGTSGVDSALSAIRALHSLVVELFGADKDFDDEAIPLVGTRLAWEALRGIFLRDARTRHTARKQCTDAVVAELLGSLCNTFCMHRRRLQRSRGASLVSLPVLKWCTPPEKMSSPNLTSLWDLGKRKLELSTEGTPQAKASVDSSIDDKEMYFREFLDVLSASTICDAVLDSYHYPGRVQVALVEVYSAMWPYLELHECGAVLDELVWPQFPQEKAVEDLLGMSFPQTASGDNVERDVSPTKVASFKMKDFLPPGAHLSVLLKLLEWLYAVALSCHDRISGHDMTLTERGHLASSTKRIAREGEEEDRFIDNVVARFITVIGCLLQLQHVSEEQLVRQTSVGSPQFSSTFFTACLEYLRTVVHSRFLPAGEGRQGGIPPTRRSGILILLKLYTRLLFLARTRAASYDGATSPSGSFEEVPDSLRAAVATLEGLTDTLCELVQRLVEDLGDINGATKVAEALIEASMATSPLLKNIAQRSLLTLDEWSFIPISSSQPTKGDSCSRKSSAHGSDSDGHPEKGPAHEADSSKSEGFVCLSLKPHLNADACERRRRFHAIVRHAMQGRSQTLLCRYLEEPHNSNAARLTKDLLLSICQRCDALPTLKILSNESDEVQGKDELEETRTELAYIQELLPVLARLVACCDHQESRTRDAVMQEKELRRTLSDALLSMYRVLGIIQRMPNA